MTIAGLVYTKRVVLYMKLHIFHSVNSGLFLWDGNSGILVDGIHDGQNDGASPMPKAWVNQLTNYSGLFAHVDGVLFTHLHGDHFQKNGVIHLLNGPRPLAIYGPGLTENRAEVHPLRQGLFQVYLAGVSILARDTPHDGQGFQSAKHKSYLINMKGESVFISGDAILTAEDAATFCSFSDRAVEAGFFNVYQLLSSQCHEFLRKIQPNRIFLEHLPFPEDDTYNYWTLAREIPRRFPRDLPSPELLPHMSWVDGKSAPWGPHEEGEMTDDLPGIPQHRSLF